MGRVMAVVDDSGRVLGAQFAPREEVDDETVPREQLIPMPGQRVVEFDVPDEIEQLSGTDLTRFFARVEVSWPAIAKIPRIEVTRRGHE